MEANKSQYSICSAICQKLVFYITSVKLYRTFCYSAKTGLLSLISTSFISLSCDDGFQMFKVYDIYVLWLPLFKSTHARLNQSARHANIDFSIKIFLKKLLDKNNDWRFDQVCVSHTNHVFFCGLIIPFFGDTIYYQLTEIRLIYSVVL